MNSYHHYIHPIRRIAMEEPVSHKVLMRMDRRLREHGVRSYRGWEVGGRKDPQLNFDDGVAIKVGVFGNLRRVKCPSE